MPRLSTSTQSAGPLVRFQHETLGQRIPGKSAPSARRHAPSSGTVYFGPTKAIRDQLLHGNLVANDLEPRVAIIEQAMSNVFVVADRRIEPGPVSECGRIAPQQPPARAESIEQNREWMPQ